MRTDMIDCSSGMRPGRIVGCGLLEQRRVLGCGDRVGSRVLVVSAPAAAGGGRAPLPLLGRRSALDRWVV